MDNNNGRTFPFLAVLGTTVAVCSLWLSYRSYAESKELREMQRELTAIQLKEKRAQATAAGINSTNSA